jgi:hypothetical protein
VPEDAAEGGEDRKSNGRTFTESRMRENCPSGLMRGGNDRLYHFLPVLPTLVLEMRWRGRGRWRNDAGEATLVR